MAAVNRLRCQICQPNLPPVTKMILIQKSKNKVSKRNSLSWLKITKSFAKSYHVPFGFTCISLLIGGLEHFSIYWEPNWFIFFRGVGQPPTRLDLLSWIISCLSHEKLSPEATYLGNLMGQKALAILDGQGSLRQRLGGKTRKTGLMKKFGGSWGYPQFSSK